MPRPSTVIHHWEITNATGELVASGDYRLGDHGGCVPRWYARLSA